MAIRNLQHAHSLHYTPSLPGCYVPVPMPVCQSFRKSNLTLAGLTKAGVGGQMVPIMLVLKLKEGIIKGYIYWKKKRAISEFIPSNYLILTM